MPNEDGCAALTAESSGLTRILERGAGHVHMLGICGIGMAGLAFHLARLGFRVSGCDLSPNRMAEWLRVRGIDSARGHAAAHVVDDVDWVVRSGAVADETPELAQCRALGIPVFSRGRVLAAIVSGTPAIAVSGTHGKTSTASFITQVLQAAGRAPSWCIGGESPLLGGVAGGDAGGVLVVEADESDGSIRWYEPDVAVVTNVEFDHMEHFDNVPAFESCFRQFTAHARKAVVYCADDLCATAICGALPGAVSYGFGEADLRGVQLRETGEGSAFTVLRGAQTLGEVVLPVPGTHNARNALGVVAAAMAWGLEFDEVCAGLKEIQLPLRRFECVAAREGLRVISDYAHHPAEVAALVQTALSLRPQRLIAVFQPHRYTRTAALGADFPAAFGSVDELLLLPVYAASEQPVKGGTVWDLYRCFREAPGFPGALRLAGSMVCAWHYLRRILHAGETLLVVGAGDVEQIAAWAREELAPTAPLPLASESEALSSHLGRLGLGPHTRVCLDEPLGIKTTLAVGGAADVWVEAGSLEDLCAVRRTCFERDVPFRVLGGGSNVLVSDLGVRGVTAHLTGQAFRTLELRDTQVTVGAGLSVAALLGALTEAGLGGLEFLDGIPATVGGVLRMNAGAWGQQVLDHVSWIRCLNRNGSTCIVGPTDFDAAYRRCGALVDRVAIEAGFSLVRSSAREIGERRAAARRARAWMRARRTAGSVFMNPPGDTAGRLSDEADCRGMRVGGAVVTREHGNVIEAGTACSASDIHALIELVRLAVLTRFGVRLERELHFFE